MKVSLEFECGETTCAVEPGKFCRFVGTKNFGRKYVCLLLRDTEGDSIRLRDNEKGWLARCSECLELNNE